MRRALSHPYLLVGLLGLTVLALIAGAIPVVLAPHEHFAGSCPLGAEGGHAPDLRLGDWGTPD